jgi:hypothetical protein
MEEAHHSEGEPIVSVGTISTLAQRFAIRTLESSGHEQIAHWIKEWPELLGDKAGAAIKELLQKRAKGESVTQKDTNKVAEALSNNPRAAATLLGLLTADLLEGAADAETQRKTILQTYKSVLDVICTFMASNTTSVVLKGFIHREDCISYWNFERKNLEFSSGGTDHLFPNGLEVYFIEEPPDDKRIASLNMDIRDDPQRCLPAEFYDFERDCRIAKLEHIYEAKITFNQLDPNIPPSANPKKDDPFGLGAFSGSNRVSQYSQRIPPDLAGLKGLVDSLFVAKAAQEDRTSKARRAATEIGNREKAS